LILEETARLRCVVESPFDTEYVLPSAVWVLDVLLKCVKDLDKAALLRHLPQPEVECLPEKERFEFLVLPAVLALLGVLELLVNTSQALLSLKEVEHLALLPLLEPDLFALVDPSEVVRADLVVHHAPDSSFSVVDRRLDDDSTPLALLVVNRSLSDGMRRELQC